MRKRREENGSDRGGEIDESGTGYVRNSKRGERHTGVKREPK